MKLRASFLHYAAIAGLAAGLAISTVRGADDVRRVIPTVEQIEEAIPANPLPVFTDMEVALAADRARAYLRADRPWAAWNAVSPHAAAPERAPEALVVLAARAAAGWEAWAEVRRLLDGREWLDRVGRGEGLLLLARAHDAQNAPGEAAALYRRYLDVPGAAEPGVAAARLGRVLRETGRDAEAADAFALAATTLPEAADWFRALQAEALMRAQDRAVLVVRSGAAASEPARTRQARTEAAFWVARRDHARALERIEREWRVVTLAEGTAGAAPLGLTRAGLLNAAGRTAEARDQYRHIAADDRVAASRRMEAADSLAAAASARTAPEELARAAAYEAGRRHGRAAAALRAALRAGATDEPATRLRLGMLLFDARDYRPAREALLQAAARLGDPEQVAAAELAAARARVRLGESDAGWAEIRRVVERHPRTAAAGTAHFLVGDAAPNNAASLVHYRRAAEIAASTDAREALFRLGDRSLRTGDSAAAIRAWESYVARYPTGAQTAEAAYRAGVLHERAGRADGARAMYAAAIAADPVAYHAIRAADRSGADPLARILDDSRPGVGAAADPVETANVLRRLDALEAGGLSGEWREELDAQLRRLDANPAALLEIAEGLRDRGHPIEGIRLGRRLLERRGGGWDERLLRVVFPFSYRDLIEDESRRHDIDPYLLAALIRQESSYNPKARSWVGATGLAQVMPATGRWLAPSVGITDFREHHLTVPEVSVRMGARYLRDQLRRYDGSRDLALAAYNAGPGRADRWRRELGYGRDVDAFREAIPFNETRHYVQVVLRNAVIYRRLYGDERSPGLVAAGS
jgi:soluble lytic murein transglycosylase